MNELGPGLEVDCCLGAKGCAIQERWAFDGAGGMLRFIMRVGEGWVLFVWNLILRVYSLSLN